MAKPGPTRRPHLQAVKEGNPGKRAQSDLEGGVRLPPKAPSEPDWLEWFPAVRKPTKPQLEERYPLGVVEGSLTHIEHDGKRAALAKARRSWLMSRDRETAARTRADNQRALDVARDEWRRIVAILEPQGLLSEIDRAALTDYCRCWARMDQCERDLSRNGTWVQGERGAVKNPSATLLNQLRGHFKFMVGELGLTPVARDSLNPGGVDDEDDVFD